MDKKFLKLNDIDAYRISFELSNHIFIELDKLPQKINMLIKYTNDKLKM